MTARDRLIDMAGRHKPVEELLVAAGLAALEQRQAARDHEANQRGVEAGRSGVGVLEITARTIREKTDLLNDVLDTLDTMVARAEAFEREQATIDAQAHGSPTPEVEPPSEPTGESVTTSAESASDEVSR